MHATGKTARKYNPELSSYTTISDAVLSSITFDGHSVTKVQYSIADNGALDLDPANGDITDPFGLGVSVLCSPRTRFGGSAS